MKNLLISCAVCFLTCLIGFGYDAVPHSENKIDLQLPCTFENDLITLLLPISETDSLRFYLDTGGKNYVYRSGLKKLDLRPSKKNMWVNSTLDIHFNKKQ
ncbi:MAG: hypothetical protein P8N19_06850 [Flavobacteriales bacterium]|nr:hypothetical protein [Flavobacteriales bacterium]MDG1766228.1 hypothetical protein [Flavobacteriales bacterium]